MAEVKNAFIKSKMNKDLDDRLIPSGEYRDAQNVQISRSEGSDVGALENVLGNKEILFSSAQSSFSTLVGAPNIKCIGQFVDENNTTIYSFWTDYFDTQAKDKIIYSPSAKNYILAYNISGSDNYKVLVEGAFLNFSQTNPIIGVNIIEGLLFWTDDRNQPRKINVNLANPTDNPSNTYVVPTYYADVDVSTGHIEMDENPRELPEPSTTPQPAFANEKTEQDRKQLAPLANNFFQNSSNPS